MSALCSRKRTLANEPALLRTSLVTVPSRVVVILFAAVVAIIGPLVSSRRPASAEELKKNPTPQDYIERNGGGAAIVPAGQLVLDGRRMSCGPRATVLDPNLNDYAAAPYPQFVILNMPLVAKVPTPVKLWIYSHECGHLFGVLDENKADCFAVRRGRAAGWLTAQGLGEICSFISGARPDAMHVSGTERCNLMRACFRQPTPKPGAKPAPVSEPTQ
jgi:hypothetical protein